MGFGINEQLGGTGDSAKKTMNELSIRSRSGSRSRSRMSRDDRSKSSSEAASNNHDIHDVSGSTSQSLSSPDRPSRSFQGNERLLATTPSSSLFGEVMRSVQKESLSSSKRKRNSSEDLPDSQISLSTKDPPATPQQDESSSFRIKTTQENSADHPQHQGTPSQTTIQQQHSLQTPQAKVSKAATSLFSPGGFQMMKFINNAAGSPLKTNLPETTDATTTPAKKERPLEFSIPFPPKKKRRCGDLHFPLVDWSLKDHVAIEWDPIHASSTIVGDIPLRQILLRPNSWIQQKAQQRFTSGLATSTTGTTIHPFRVPTSETELLTEWNESLLYWQYPATNPFVSDETSVGNRGPQYRTNTNSQMLRFHGNTSASISHFGGASRFGDATVRNRQTAHKLRRWHEEARGQTASLKEWRDVFWSLYSKWRLTIQQLAVSSLDSKNSQTILKDASRACFYVCGAGHSILFRVKVEREHQQDTPDASWEDDFSSEESEMEGDQETDSWKFIPEIVLSSSSGEMRTKLRRMGIRCRFATEVGGFGTNFDSEEDFWKILEESTQSRSSNPNTEISSPSVAADLIALRREQAMGKTIGADITVKTQSKRNKKRPRRSPRRMPPLVVSTDQDCAAFAEWYLNTGGKVFHDPSVVDDRVPILLCRHLGPFLHSNMKQIRVLQPTRSNSPAVFLKGFILPCAMREVLHSVILLSKKTEAESSRSDEGLLMQARSRVHGGFASPLTEGAIGGPSTILFNNESEDAQSSRQKRLAYCHCGEVVEEISITSSASATVDIKLLQWISNGFR